MIEQITGELSDLLWQREQIRMIAKMIDGNPELLQDNKPFLWEVRRWYSVFAAIAVRRQMDRDPKMVSLAQLITEMQAKSECISRELLVEKHRRVYPNSAPDDHFERAIVDGMWDKWRDATGNLSIQRLDSDLENLEREAKAIYIFASSTIAHTSKKAIGRDHGITFNDLDTAIDHLEQLAMDYYSLLTGRRCSTLLPTPQYDWHRQFRFAWKPSAVEDSLQ